MTSDEISKLFLKIVSLALLAGLTWTAWAAGAFYDLTSALRSGDPVGLERRIDWANVRQELREDLLPKPLASTSDRTIDALLSRQGIINLLRTAKLDDRGWETIAMPADDSPAFAWNRIRYAFYTGSPFAFRVDLEPDSDTVQAPLVLLFRWTGDWRLVRVFVPEAEPATPQVASRGPLLSEPAAAPPTPGTARVSLYEEIPGGQGKRYDGTVTWRAEQVQATAGNVAGFTVIAQVKVPERPLDMTMSIRRNLDPTLPATHTVELSFDSSSDASTGGVTDMVGIMMKPDQEAAGQHVAASRVKVRDGFFILGLSALDVDARHNSDLLRNRPWFGIPIRYTNGGRAVLVIEKGETGDRAFAEAFTRWTADAAGARAQKK
jgi:DUF2939 family protein